MEKKENVTGQHYRSTVSDVLDAVLDMYEYFVWHSAADDAFLATFPDLPGCIAAGKSVSEAVHNLRILTKSWLDTAVEHRYKLPAPMPRDTHIPPSAYKIEGPVAQIETKEPKKDR